MFKYIKKCAENCIWNGTYYNFTANGSEKQLSIVLMRFRFWSTDYHHGPNEVLHFSLVERERWGFALSSKKTMERFQLTVVHLRCWLWPCSSIRNTITWIDRTRNWEKCDQSFLCGTCFLLLQIPIILQFKNLEWLSCFSKPVTSCHHKFKEPYFKMKQDRITMARMYIETNINWMRKGSQLIVLIHNTTGWTKIRILSTSSLKSWGTENVFF